MDKRVNWNEALNEYERRRNGVCPGCLQTLPDDDLQGTGVRFCVACEVEAVMQEAAYEDECQAESDLDEWDD